MVLRIILASIMGILLTGNTWAATFVFNTGKSYQTATKTGGAVISVPVHLTAKHASTATVDLIIAGAKSQVEDYGFGKDYTLAGTGVGSITNTAYETTAATITFAPNEVDKTATITIENNPTVNLDRNIKVSLANPSAGNKTFYTCLTLKLSDNTRAGIVDVTNATQVHALDVTANALDKTGATDATTSLQKIITAAGTTGYILYFPTGTYTIGTASCLTGVPSNLTFLGDGADKSIIKFRNAPLLGAGSVSNITNAIDSKLTVASHGVSPGTINSGVQVYFPAITQAGWTDLTAAYRLWAYDSSTLYFCKYNPIWGANAVMWHPTLARGATTTVTLASHHVANGDHVYFYGLTGEWAALNNRVNLVSGVTASTFVIDYDSSALTADHSAADGYFFILIDNSARPSWTGTTAIRKQVNGAAGRMFANAIYSSASDSNPIAFKNILIDGNAFNQGPFQNYELNLNACIFFDNPTASAGRLLYRIEKAKIISNSGAGAEVRRNVKAKLYYTDINDCYFGGITMTGGEAACEYVKGSILSPNCITGIDIEPSSGATGAGGSYGNSLTILSAIISGDLDLGYHVNSRLTDNVLVMKDTTVGVYTGYPFSGNNADGWQMLNLSSGDIQNCTFYSAGPVTGIGCGLTNPYHIAFTNCHFIATKYYGNGSYWHIDHTPAICAVSCAWSGGALATDNIVTFTNCTFKGASDVPGGVNKYGFFNNYINPARLTLTNTNPTYINLNYNFEQE